MREDASITGMRQFRIRSENCISDPVLPSLPAIMDFSSDGMSASESLVPAINGISFHEHSAYIGPMRHHGKSPQIFGPEQHLDE
jgi:hypothetical protein